MTSDPVLTLPDVRIGGSRIVLAPHNCFACGTLNSHGLHLDLHAGDDRCWTEMTLDRRFEGWEGIAHGGIVCTLLDEVMAWALVDHDLWGVTARLAVDFKRPVPINRLIRAEGRVVAVRRRLVDAAGVVIDPATGEILARAEATYFGAPEARKQELKERYAFRLEPDSIHGGAAATTGLPELVDVG
ncbi:MAG TPA: PaaI family thioesterase [Candidatus Limnocylindrales bacterium]